MSSEDPFAGEPETLAPLLEALRDLSNWLQATEAAGTIIGGVAASLLGRPRLTRDVDAMVMLDEGKWGEFLSAGERLGFVPRLPDPLEFARKARVLLVRHEATGIDVDVVFGGLRFEEEAVERASWVEVSGIRVPLPTPEDLIIMKAIAHRPRDLADIESLLDAHRKLDTRRVLRWVRELSNALEKPEILRDVKSLLARHRSPR